MIRPALSLFAALAVGACADAPAGPAADADDRAGQGADSASIVVRGVVVEKIYDGAALRVDHEAVPALGMEPMQMALPLESPALADGLRPGDKVALTVSAAPRLRVTAVTPLPAATPLALAADSARAGAR